MTVPEVATRRRRTAVIKAALPSPSTAGSNCCSTALGQSRRSLLRPFSPTASAPRAGVKHGVAIGVAQLVGTLGSWGQAEIFLSRFRSGTDHYRMHSRITWVGGFAASVVSALVMLALHLPLSAVLVTAVWVPVVTQIGLWRSVSIARSQLKPPALDGAFGAIFRVAAFATLAALTLLTVDSALFAYQATLGLGSLLTVGLATRRSGLKAQGQEIGARALLLSGTGIIAFNLLHAVTLRADLIVLQLVAPPTEVGLYAAPVGITGAALALSTAYRPRVQAAAFSAAPLRGILHNCLQASCSGPSEAPCSGGQLRWQWRFCSDQASRARNRSCARLYSPLFPC